MKITNTAKIFVACPKPTLWGGLVGLLLLTVSSCTSIELEDMPDPTPEMGQVSLITDWTNRTAGIAVPSTYTLMAFNQTITCDNVAIQLPPLPAASYPILLYNTAEKISIAGTTANVTTAAGIADPALGWFFSSALDIVYEDGKQKLVTAVMQQQVRQLTIELTVKEGDANRIQGITAQLSGVASQLDMKTNEHSAGVKVVPLFTRSNDKLSANVRLLGITRTSQNLTINLTFTDNRTQVIESELKDKLTGFNSEKHKPMLLTADLNTPVEVGFTATITGWKSVPNSGGVAN